MKIAFLIIFITVMATFVFGSAEAAVCSQKGYCFTLTPTDEKEDASRLAAIFNPRDPPEKIFAGLFNFLLGFVGIGAMVMIVIEGIKYMTSAGDQSKIGEAKRKIWNAVWGLILALISYLLLQTINPDLIKPGLKSFDLQKQEGSQPIQPLKVIPKDEFINQPSTSPVDAEIKSSIGKEAGKLPIFEAGNNITPNQLRTLLNSGVKSCSGAGGDNVSATEPGSRTYVCRKCQNGRVASQKNPTINPQGLSGFACK